jgi:hypothetical protein
MEGKVFGCAIPQPVSCRLLTEAEFSPRAYRILVKKVTWRSYLSFPQLIIIPPLYFSTCASTVRPICGCHVKVLVTQRHGSVYVGNYNILDRPGSLAVVSLIHSCISFLSKVYSPTFFSSILKSLMPLI